MKILVTLAILGLLTGASAQPSAPVKPVLLGDYDMELRRGDHVDNALLAQRLKDLGANTYMWLICHAANDWEDLHGFLPLAKAAGISVWVYLVPYSETGLENPTWPYPEPFRVDYVRWAQEIGKLSLQHDNLVGWVIDDFWANVSPGHFTPETIQRFVAAGRAVNPKLKFYPLMYYPEIGVDFMETVGPLVDGVVAAYPKDRAEIEAALPFLNDEYNVLPGMSVAYPPNTPSKAGEHGCVLQTVEVTDPRTASLSFQQDDNYDGPTAGYHFLQVRVDDQVVWEQDAAGRHNGPVTVDLAQAVKDKPRVTLALGVWNKKGVYQFPVRATFGALKLTGLKAAQPDLSNPEGWRLEVSGAFSLQRRPAREGHGRRRLPLIVMTAGQRVEFELRHPEKATPESIARHVKEALGLAREGRIEGLVTYCLDKSPGNSDLEAVKKVFADFRAGR